MRNDKKMSTMVSTTEQIRRYMRWRSKTNRVLQIELNIKYKAMDPLFIGVAFKYGTT